MTRRPFTLLTLLLAMLSTAAMAATITNGGFEQDTCGGVCSFTPSGWTLTQGDVEVIGNGYWNPAEGVNSLDLDGVAFGGISQVIATIPGAFYTMTFSMAGNPGGAPTVKLMRVSAAGAFATALGDYQFDTTGTSSRNMGWVDHSFGFSANSSSTTLEFRSLNTAGGSAGAALDNIRISGGPAVPEPATGLLAGLAFAGLLAFRRR